MIGKTLGPYQITEKLGEGGMGEVYRARDTRLDRTVAIKVLPTHIAGVADLRERFEREARAISSLDHPHICALYDVGEHEGTAFLVMQYLDGETLADRLKKGALPFDQALEIGTQIADALDKAHRAGIIHRDLKPGNIMLTSAGAKLLDFGLAKTRATSAAAPFSIAATQQSPLTAQGTILGTFHYMAPEQIDGAEADARTDIFAFGVVLYEMLTGKKAFEGKTQASLFGAIIKDQPPPVSLVQPLAPSSLDQVVRACLQKDPDDRIQSAHDLRLQLEWVAGLEPSVRVAPARRPVRVIAATAIVTALAVGAGTYLVTQPLPPSPRPVSRLIVQPSTALTNFEAPPIAMSPDGTRLVYVGMSTGGGSQLYLRRLDELTASPIRGTEGGFGPFFSPDGEWIGFTAGGQLKKVPTFGGAALPITQAQQARGATWLDDGSIVFMSAGSAGLQRVSAAGGKPEQLTTLDQATELSHRWPHWIPGTKAVLYTVGRPGAGAPQDFNSAAVALLRLDTGERRILLEGASNPLYVDSGHLVFSRAGVALAVSFDVRSLTVTGAPAPVVDGMATNPGTGAGHMAVSRIGVMAYVPGVEGQLSRLLAWVDRKGVAQDIKVAARSFEEPRMSPDGERVAFNVTGSSSDVWIYHLPRQTFTRFSFGESQDETPVWSPDGKRIAYISQQGNVRSVVVKVADGSGAEQKIASGEGHLHVNSWSPRDDVLVIANSSGDGGSDLYTLRIGEGSLEPFLKTPFAERGGTVSPNGKWIAYSSNESSSYEVYVQAFPGPGGKFQVSVDGGTEPVWASTGREIFFRAGLKMMAASVAESGDALTIGTPEQLFEGRYSLSTAGEPYYTVTADGKRFLMMKAPDQDAGDTIVVVQEWWQELTRLVRPPGTR